MVCGSQQEDLVATGELKILFKKDLSYCIYYWKGRHTEREETEKSSIHPLVQSTSGHSGQS